MRFLILLCLSFPLMAYDQFEGYDLSNPYPETNMDDWNRVQEQRREDLRDLEWEERDDPYREDQRFEIEYNEN